MVRKMKILINKKKKNKKVNPEYIQSNNLWYVNSILILFLGSH